jgi:signal transduction histidine kinase
MYQHAIVAVNDQPVATSEDVYTAVRRLPADSAVTYTLEKDGQRTTVILPSQSFALQDYVLLFGAYLLTGLAIAFIGIGVWFLKPSAAASHALLTISSGIGLFFLTATDLYGPHWFFRLHVVSEAFLFAGFVHLALVFPVARFPRFCSSFIAAPYLVSLALTVAYEIFLYRPDVYSLIHSLCELYASVSGLPLLGNLFWSYGTTDSHLIRQRIRVIFLGFLGAFAIPAVLSLSSSLTGGSVAVNYSVFTISLFPLSLGYAIVKHDLFEIDALVKRGAYYLTLTATLTLAYVVCLAFLNVTLSSSEFARSPLFPLLFTLSAVFLLNPLKERVQRGVDRVFSRLRYDPKKVLEATSASLTATLRLEEIFTYVGCTVSETLGVKTLSIFLLNADKSHYIPVYTTRDQERRRLTIEHALIERVRQQQGKVLSLYDLDEDEPTPQAEECRHGFLRLGAQLIIPLVLKGDLLGFLALSGKESGAFFSADDRDFLYTLANQSALSISNALSYEEIAALNMTLEKKVNNRTHALAHANKELQASLQQLEQTYQNLQRSQESLVRSEKMAALGRLAAGIAHEMNTPLGASLTSLQLVQDLVKEYAESIGDPTVTEEDHRDIAAEMDKLVHSTKQWMEKAAGHIRSLKLHTRNLQRAEEKPFSVLQVVEDTGILLSHRLRLSQCKIKVSRPLSSPTLNGDPGKLGQVLTNLIVNAIDAYRAAGKKGGTISVAVQNESDVVEIRVSDQGCGIPPENLNKIFDELFSTKPLGEGTGLGLSISRDIIANFFGGTITVESEVGQGSTFILRLPDGHSTKEERPIPEGQPTLVIEHPPLPLQEPSVLSRTEPFPA